MNFKQRKDIIESVVNCTIDNSGRRVRIESIVRRTLCINFFNNPEGNYGDLLGVKKVMHDCRDKIGA